MVDIHNIRKTYRKSAAPALDGISFSASPGRITGILGANGAGKTTLLRILATVLQPDTGTARIAGFDLIRDSRDVRRSIGFLFGGEAGLYDRLTARENIRYFADLNGVRPDDRDRQIRRYARLLDMEHFLDLPAGRFSRGMKQKTSILRALIHDPPVVLFDEPTAGLDFAAARAVHDCILDWKRQGRTVLLSSHDLSEIEMLCDRIVILHQGRVLEDDAPASLREKFGGTLLNAFPTLRRSVGVGNVGAGEEQC